MLNEFRLALSLLRRELRAGHWIIIFFALVLAVMTITAINFYTDRLSRGLSQQSAKLLGGDLVISSPSPINKDWVQKAKDLKLRSAQILIFPSVVSANNQLQLVNIQAVSDNFPLIGEPIHIKHKSVLVEFRLLQLLSINIADNLTIGAGSFNIEGLQSNDVDLLNTGWAIAPRVLMRLDDVPATKIVLPGSRVNYRLLLAGDEDNINAFSTWLKPQLKAGQKIIDTETQRFSIHKSLKNANKYIQLVVLFCLLMCGTAITLSTRQHLHRHFGDVALWRCLGASEKQIIHVFVMQLLILALVAGVIGTIVGHIIQVVISHLFTDFIQLQLPLTSYRPIMLGIFSSIILLFCYAFPIISVLPKTSPLYLWRGNISTNSKQKNLYAIITLVLLLAYVYWIMDFSLLALFFLDALLLTIGFLYILNALALSITRRMICLTKGSVRRGLSQLIQHPETAIIQLTAFTIILMSILILNMVKNDLIVKWSKSLPADTPNYYAINIARYDIKDLKELFAANQIKDNTIYPMVRGRLIELDDKPIFKALPKFAHQHNSLHRELNLSSMLVYPSDNKIVSGKKWDKSMVGAHFISIEKTMATELLLKLGDKLTFQVGDKKVSGVINNIRTVEWGSFHPNFYVIFPPDVLENLPTTYITSFHLDSGNTLFLNKIVKKFPNITIIDIAGVLKQVQSLLSKIAMALEYLFAFAFCAAVLIFFTSILASMDERKKTYHLLRVLGASRRYIISSLVVEFTFLGLLTVAFSFAIAKLISYLLLLMIF